MMVEYPRMMRRSVGSQIEFKQFNRPEDVEPGWHDAETERLEAQKPVDRNWPAWRYPPGEGASAGKVFTKAEDVPEGWVDSPTGVDAPKAPAIKPPSNPKDAAMRYEKAETENIKLRESVALLEAQLDAKTRECAALNDALKAAKDMEEGFQPKAQEGEAGEPAPTRRAKKAT
jgi:hypothetical protein